MIDPPMEVRRPPSIESMRQRRKNGGLSTAAPKRNKNRGITHDRPRRQDSGGKSVGDKNGDGIGGHRGRRSDAKERVAGTEMAERIIVAANQLTSARVKAGKDKGAGKQRGGNESGSHARRAADLDERYQFRELPESSFKTRTTSSTKQRSRRPETPTTTLGVALPLSPRTPRGSKGRHMAVRTPHQRHSNLRYSISSTQHWSSHHSQRQRYDELQDRQSRRPRSSPAHTKPLGPLLSSRRRRPPTPTSSTLPSPPSSLSRSVKRTSQASKRGGTHRAAPPAQKHNIGLVEEIEGTDELAAFEDRLSLRNRRPPRRSRMGGTVSREHSETSQASSYGGGQNWRRAPVGVGRQVTSNHRASARGGGSLLAGRVAVLERQLMEAVQVIASLGGDVAHIMALSAGGRGVLASGGGGGSEANRGPTEQRVHRGQNCKASDGEIVDVEQGHPVESDLRGIVPVETFVACEVDNVKSRAYDDKGESNGKRCDMQEREEVIAKDSHPTERPSQSVVPEVAASGPCEDEDFLTTSAADAEKSLSVQLLENVRSGHYDNVDDLIGSGGDTNITDEVGRTPLFWAARNGSVDTVRRLLLQGGDPEKATRHCELRQGAQNFVPLDATSDTFEPVPRYIKRWCRSQQPGAADTEGATVATREVTTLDTMKDNAVETIDGAGNADVGDDGNLGELQVVGTVTREMLQAVRNTLELWAQFVKHWKSHGCFGLDKISSVTKNEQVRAELCDLRRLARPPKRNDEWRGDDNSEIGHERRRKVSNSWRRSSDVEIGGRGARSTRRRSLADSSGSGGHSSRIVYPLRSSELSPSAQLHTSPRDAGMKRQTVYLSHSSIDAKTVATLRQQITKRGFQVKVSGDGTLVEDAGLFVCCMSPSFCRSLLRGHETIIAKRRKMAIIPVLVAPMPGWPPEGICAHVAVAGAVVLPPGTRYLDATDPEHLSDALKMLLPLLEVLVKATSGPGITSNPAFTTAATATAAVSPQEARYSEVGGARKGSSASYRATGQRQRSVLQDSSVGSRRSSTYLRGVGSKPSRHSAPPDLKIFPPPAWGFEGGSTDRDGSEGQDERAQ